MKFFRTVLIAALALSLSAGALFADQSFTQAVLHALNDAAPQSGEVVPIISGGVMKNATVSAINHAGVATFNNRKGDVTLSASDVGAAANASCAAGQWFSAFSGAGVFVCSQPSFANISGTIAPGQLPAATTSAYGAIQAIAALAHEVVQYIDNSGVPHLVQLAFGDLSGSAACSQLPALTGDVTTSAGSCGDAIAANVVTNAKLAQAAANTLNGNPTGSTANKQEIPIGDCHGTSNALTYTAGSGFGCNTLSAATQPLIGNSANVGAGLTAAGTTVTITADEIVTGTALGGSTTKLASYSQPLNLATTGAGGMDTGAAPANGYVAVYGIYGTTPGASVIAVNASTSNGTIYGGTHMPSGYTQSALLALWPTDGTGKLKPGYLHGREFSYYGGTFPQVLSNVAPTANGTLQTLSMSAGIPPGAKAVTVLMGIHTSGSAQRTLSVASDVVGTNLQSAVNTGSGPVWYPGNAIDADGMIFRDLPIVTAQQIAWALDSNTVGADAFTTGFSW